MGWSYGQLISNMILRYKNFRATENTYSSYNKFQHVEYCSMEIDAIIGTRNDIKETDKVKFSWKPEPGKIDQKVLEQYLCAMQTPFGTEDEIGRKAAQGEDLPELRDVNFEEIVDRILDESNPGLS